MESFINMPPELAYGLSVWRPVAPSFEDVMDNGLPFLRSNTVNMALFPVSRFSRWHERAAVTVGDESVRSQQRRAALRMSIFSRPPDRSTRRSPLRRSSGIEMER